MGQGSRRCCVTSLGPISLGSCANYWVKDKRNEGLVTYICSQRSNLQVLEYSMRIFCATGNVDAPDLSIPTKYSTPKVVSETELHQQYITALKEWHQVKGNAANFRTQHLEDLIQFHSERKDLKRETAVKQILHWEEIRNLHGRQSQMMTSSKTRVIRTLLVPRPHSEDLTALMEITDPACIQQIILTRNASKLAAAHGSPFTMPPLTSIIGNHGDTQAADETRLEPSLTFACPFHLEESSFSWQQSQWCCSTTSLLRQGSIIISHLVSF